jgi:hypothetical protein
MNTIFGKQWKIKTRHEWVEMILINAGEINPSRQVFGTRKSNCMNKLYNLFTENG